ncbi:PA domain-containing protein [Lachnospiraceae bacterium XBB1006]|nr:PA domain-containing protein [Lachnospiraceae bacterium XBB1006]
MKRKQFLSVLLSALMVCTMIPMNVAANGDDAQRRENLDVIKLEEAKKDLERVPEGAQDTAESATNIKPNEMVTVIIDYDKAPVLEKVDDPGKYDSYGELVEENSSAVTSVEKSVDKVTKAIEDVVSPNKKGEEPETLYKYSVAFSGSAMKVAYKDIQKIKKVAGVNEVYLSQRYSIPELQENKEVPNMMTSREMIHVDELQETTGYTGEGMLVAVLDTGVAYEHDAFQTMPKHLSINKSGIKDTIKDFDLTAEENYATNTTSEKKTLVSTGKNASAEEIAAGKDNGNVYKSDKVPFGYDYSNHDTNPTPLNESNHGTHVAGTVAGNSDEIKGVAPDAQIAAMKVFRDDGYAYQEELMAALQDCVIIGVDSVNMSLGSCAGFTKVENQELQTAYDNVGKAGINLNISAGNNYTSAYGSNYGNYSLATNPDEGVVGSPSTLDAALSVASIENTNMGPAAYIQLGEGEDAVKFGFSDNGTKVGMGLDTLAAGTYEVVDCGFGREDDFKTIEVEKKDENGETVVDENGNPEMEKVSAVAGKIALVSRGEISFGDKDVNAAEAGAIAVIVYNNQPGSIGMSIPEYRIPAVSILQAEGKKIIESMEDGVTTISYDPEVTYNLPNPEAEMMSDFSSLGTTPDLGFKPEITAPGGNIWSAYYVEDGKSVYGNMSGTSMACPHMAGAAAVMKQFVNESGHKRETAQEKRALINALEMSTATPVTDVENGVLYSPRKQGAGLVNLMAATRTPAYLSVEGSEKPEVAMGWNEEGEYSYTVTVNRFGEWDDELVYKVNTTVLTEDVIEKAGAKVAAQYALDITDAVEVTYEGLDEDGQIVLPENEDTVSFTVTLKVDKDAEILAEVREAFTNGFFVEGFTQLEGLTCTEDVVAQDLSVPFMGFCGNWAKLPMFDNSQFEGNATFGNGNGLVSEFVSGGRTYAYPIGLNYFKAFVLDKTEYDEDYGYLSNISATGALDNCYPSTYLLRGAAKLDYRVENEAGEVIADFHNENVRKTYMNMSSGNLLIAENFTDDFPYVENTAKAPMKEGTYKFILSALPAGVEDTEENRQEQVHTFRVDNTAPVVNTENTSVFVDDEGKLMLEVDASDNCGLAGVEVDVNLMGRWTTLGAKAFEKEDGKEQHILVDLGFTKEQFEAYGMDANDIGVIVYDYALNGTDVSVALDKKPEAANTTIASVENTKNGEMTVTINESKGATGYKVYRATKANGKYTQVADIHETVFVDKKATTMKTTYFYKVKPYADGTYRKKEMHVEAEMSPAVSAKALLPAKTNGVKITKILRLCTITWKQVSKADGYEVYRADNNGEFELIKTTGKILSIKADLLGKGTYKYKVRAFVKDGGKKYFGEFSDVKSVTVK